MSDKEINTQLYELDFDPEKVKALLNSIKDMSNNSYSVAELDEFDENRKLRDFIGEDDYRQPKGWVTNFARRYRDDYQAIIDKFNSTHEDAHVEIREEARDNKGNLSDSMMSVHMVDPKVSVSNELYEEFVQFHMRKQRGE